MPVTVDHEAMCSGSKIQEMKANRTQFLFLFLNLIRATGLHDSIENKYSNDHKLQASCSSTIHLFLYQPKSFEQNTLHTLTQP